MAKDYNLKIKYYNGSMQVKYYLMPIKNNDDEFFIDEIISKDVHNAVVPEDEFSSGSSPDEQATDNKIYVDKDRSIRNSISRTVNKIYDYARSNDWEYFITLTIDSKMDRYNYSDIKKKVCKTFNNWKNRKCPNLKYLIVHEYHKDGAIHFHGLLSNCEGLNLQMARNPNNNKVLRDNNLRTIYNILDFKLGFCTATKVSDTFKASSYICKYISKEVTPDTYIPNIQRYFVSNNCDLPQEFTYYVTKEEFYKFMSDFNPDYFKIINSDYNRVYLYEINDNENNSSTT